MNTRAVFLLISFLLTVIALAMAGCWAVAHYFNDPVPAQHAFAWSSGIVFLVGIVMYFITRGPMELSRRDGFGIVTFGWLAAAMAGSLPYLFSHDIANPVTALFETMSGFTTTGASALDHLESLPKGILFWRSLTQWLGGMGVLVLCVAILPFLGVGGMQIYRAEMPGPSKDRLTPRITSTAKLLWGVYLLLSIAEAGLLRIGGLSWYDALCHTFATMSTGGFSTRTASVGAYNSAYVEVVIIIFMVLAGANFALHFKALRGDVKGYFRDPEFRFYIILWLGCSLFVLANIWGPVYASGSDALRAAFFQTTSILTTTGFCTADFDVWPSCTRLLLVMLMFVGASAGSTAGGIKAIRVQVVLKKALREVRVFMRPKAVFQIKLGGNPVDKDVVTNISAFFVIFVLIFGLATLVMTFFTPDLETAASSVVATLGNIGPGLSAVGATQNYADIPNTGKLILTGLMLLGRLELYTVLVLFFPAFWKK